MKHSSQAVSIDQLPARYQEQVRKQLYPNAKIDSLCQVPDPKPQQDKAPALDRAVQRKAKSIRRSVVRFTGYRVQPLDPDNFAGSCKDLLDGLRHAGLILGDEWWRITLETQQVKVSHFCEEMTVIEL